MKHELDINRDFEYIKEKLAFISSGNITHQRGNCILGIDLLQKKLQKARIKEKRQKEKTRKKIKELNAVVRLLAERRAYADPDGKGRYWWDCSNGCGQREKLSENKKKSVNSWIKHYTSIIRDQNKLKKLKECTP